MLLEDFEGRYNIAPTATVPAFTREGWRKMRWGLVPSWSKEPKTKYSTFNARLESFTDKPMYRSSWNNDRRCLIPVSGYYEWRNEKGEKVPFYVCSIHEEPLVFAGLWEKWINDDITLLSCTIITTRSSGSLQNLHHRMPVMLEPDQADMWLNGDKKSAFEVLQLVNTNHIQYYRVSKDVGNPRNQGNKLVLPFENGLKRNT